MKPAPFEYFAPTTTDEALALLNEHGYDAKILAGGQSLVPTMNFRLSQPAVLIDINNIADLSYINSTDNGGLSIGTLTRQRSIERSDLIADRAPLLTETMPHIAHVQIRNRGTIGGSLAHADPAAELPPVAVTLDARFRLRSATGERWVNARDFYIGLFTTDLAPNEMIVEIEIPPTPARTGHSIHEIARRHGDYAMVGVATSVTLDEAGTCTDAKIVFLSVGEGPVSATQSTQSLIGNAPTDATITTAAELAATTDIDPTGDIHATAKYRRHLAKVLTKRALRDAVERANE